jgi:hypothetical protein
MYQRLRQASTAIALSSSTAHERVCFSPNPGPLNACSAKSFLSGDFAQTHVFSLLV